MAAAVAVAIEAVQEPGDTSTRRKRKLPKTLSRDEMTRLLAAPNVKCPTGLRNRAMLELVYRSGIRVGELVALHVRDVDLDEGTVRIEAGKSGDGTSYFDPDRVAPWIREWLTVRRRELRRRGKRVPVDGHLFTTLQGGPVSKRYVQQMIKRCAVRAGVPPKKVTPHVLRHTYATELLGEGFSTRDVQEALRHADLATTEIYTHVLDVELRNKIRGRS